MNQHAIPVRNDMIETIAPEVLRAAIDEVATIRASTIRVGFFGTLIFRPDPASPTPADVRASHLDILEMEVKRISAVCSTLLRAAPLGEAPGVISTWFQGIAATRPDALAKISQIDLLSQEVLTIAQNRPKDLGEALNRHMSAARSGFFEAVTEVCDAIWSELSLVQNAQLSSAHRAAALLSDRLSRLERIGKHVRLVSLNASVEAARAGDVGKGLMLIANEFKVLAEEIQALAQGARDDVGKMSAR